VGGGDGLGERATEENGGWCWQQVCMAEAARRRREKGVAVCAISAWVQRREVIAAKLSGSDAGGVGKRWLCEASLWVEEEEKMRA